MTLWVFCIVEGHGDVDAFPLLIRRIALERLNTIAVVERAFRLPKGKMMQQAELCKAVEFGALRLRQQAREEDRMLIVISRDADDECPVDVAQTINRYVQGTSAAAICAAVVPNEEFEAWLLAGADALVNHVDCRPDFIPPDDADAIRSPKGLFERAVLRDGRTYSETVDQAKFVAQISLDDAAVARSRSLRRLQSALA